MPEERDSVIALCRATLAQLGLELRRLRRARRWSQTDVEMCLRATGIRVPPGFVSECEHGTQTLPFLHFTALCRLFQVRPGDLMTWVDTKVLGPPTEEPTALPGVEVVDVDTLLTRSSGHWDPVMTAAQHRLRTGATIETPAE
jgi:hypothetical protein